MVVAAFSLCPNLVFAQEIERLRLTGYVRSGEDREVIRNARIQVVESGFVTETNRFGFYSLLLNRGTYTITVSNIGYEAVTKTVAVERSATLDFELAVRPLILADLSVSIDREPSDVDPNSVEMSVIRIDVPAISEIPVVLGEADPIRALTLYPGVSAVSDFTSEINVRGGAADENLILLDDSQVFTPSHALGLFSVFNADAVDNVSLYKGGIPSRYGGRLSSVLDIQQREGNAREFEGTGTIGLLASRLRLQGPLFSDKGSWLVAGRRTYADLFLGLSNDPDVKESAVFFYDLNAKANYRIGATGQLMLSGYFGRDRFKLSDIASVGWGNSAGTLRWNQSFGSIFSHVTVAYSDYDYNLQIGTNRTAVFLDSKIRSMTVKIDESWQLMPNSRLDFGFAFGDYEVQPSNIVLMLEQAVIEEQFDYKNGVSPEAYIEHELDLGQLTLRYGMRGSGFMRRGAETVFLYENNAPVVYRPRLGRYQRGVVVDSVQYKKGETIKSFWGLEPRASLRIGLGNSSALKASYSRTRQYLRRVSNTNSPTPFDIWDPVGPYVDPSVADQFAVGFTRTLGSGTYGLSAELYYKDSRNLVDYVDGGDIVLNEYLETIMLQGFGRSYGFEVLFRKNTGRLRGWASYTLSRSRQKTPGMTTEDPGVNGGDWYPSPYDRPHDLSVTAIYDLNNSWSFGTNFIFSSGLPTTYPLSRYQFAGVLLGEYGSRNAERLSNYHRLDISFTKRLSRGELQFGVFNAYNRFNAQALAFRQREDSRFITEAVETAVFGVVPSISYRFFF